MMMFHRSTLSIWLTLLSLFAGLSIAEDGKIIKATSLVPCMKNSSLTATQFDVVFTPQNRTIQYDVSATVNIEGTVIANILVYVYGIKIIEKRVDPCKENIKQLCRISTGQIDIVSSSTLSEDIVKSIPGVAYTVPDIDCQVYFQILDTQDDMIACIRADLSNGKTVNHVAVKWVTAVISGIGLLTSAVLSTMGSSYTAAHIAANSIALFSYFQSVVIVCMEAVDRVPPIASSWSQNIAWSMGLIKVTFMQKIFRWYVQATGGTPTTYLMISTISILVQRAAEINTRAQNFVLDHARRYGLVGRATEEMDKVAHSSNTLLIFRGINRVAYQAGIEQTSVVLTGFTFFVLICLAVAIVFSLFRLVLMFSFKSRFVFYRANWRVMLKGTLLRILFIGVPQLLILSFWEFVERDSAAVIILAVFFLILSAGIICWHAFKVFVIGRQSLESYGTPAYMLFSDPQVMNKYGSLYIQFDASRYYFILYILGYIGIKALFIAFAQSSGKTQGLTLFVLELAYLILICVMKPFMDKSTNVVNIIIQVINMINALFFLFFSDLLTQPQVISSIMGVVFFVLNAAFSLILLVYTLVTCSIVLFSKNPDNRYKPAKDDRASFIQNSDNSDVHGFNNELKALGAAARADHEDDGMFRSHPYDPTPDEMNSARGTPNPFSEKGYDASSFTNDSALDSEHLGPLRTAGGHARDDSYTALNSHATGHRDSRGWRMPHLPNILQRGNRDGI